MIKNMAWGTFLLWGMFDAIIAVLAFFFLKETKGLSLEVIAQQSFNRGEASNVAPAGHKVDDLEEDDLHQR